MYFVIKGIVLGLLIAAPVGPIGVLCITRTLRAGWNAGFFTGLGAASADALYSGVAAFGVTSVTSALSAAAPLLHIAGAAFLVYLGYKAFITETLAAATSDALIRAPQAYGSTVVLTLLNPATIFSFLAIFAAAAGSHSPSFGVAVRLVVGVFTGSCIWWLLLATGISLMRRSVGPAITSALNRLSGLLLIGFAAYALASR